MIHIFGGAGFVGSRLAAALSQSGHDFRIYDVSLAGNAHVDVADADSLDQLPSADVVINLAAEHRDDVKPASLYRKVNVTGASNVCDYCRKVGAGTIIFTSSVAVYGFAGSDSGEDTPLQPFNDYGRSKVDAEKVYTAWQAEAPETRSLVIIRPTVIFGEGNRGNVYNLMQQIASRRFFMVGAGENIKSMAYVENVAQFIIFSSGFGPGQHIYNYVDKPDLNVKALVKLMREHLLGKNDIGLRMPVWCAFFMAYLLNVFSTVTRIQTPVSPVRVRKFLESTAFSTKAPLVCFIPHTDLKSALINTLDHEFPSAKRS